MWIRSTIDESQLEIFSCYVRLHEYVFLLVSKRKDSSIQNVTDFGENNKFQLKFQALTNVQKCSISHIYYTYGQQMIRDKSCFDTYVSSSYYNKTFILILLFFCIHAEFDFFFFYIVSNLQIIHSNDIIHDLHNGNIFNKKTVKYLKAKNNQLIYWLILNKLTSQYFLLPMPTFYKSSIYQ